MKTHPHRPVRQGREVLDAAEPDLGQGLVDRQRDAVRPGERRDRLPLPVEDFHRQLAPLGGDVHEQAFPAEADGPRGEHAGRRAAIHRREAVAPQHGQPGVGAAVPEFAVECPPAEVEIELVAHDEAPAAGRLHVAPIPGVLNGVDRQERPPIGAVPVKAVAAVAQQDFVAFVDSQLGASPVLRPLPDRKQPEQQAFVGHGVEVVQLRLDSLEPRIRMVRVETVCPDPRHHLPTGPRQGRRQVGVLAVVPCPGDAPVAQAQHPHAAKRIVETRAAVAALR